MSGRRAQSTRKSVTHLVAASASVPPTTTISPSQRTTGTLATQSVLFNPTVSDESAPARRAPRQSKQDALAKRVWMADSSRKRVNPAPEDNNGSTPAKKQKQGQLTVKNRAGRRPAHHSAQASATPGNYSCPHPRPVNQSGIKVPAQIDDVHANVSPQGGKLCGSASAKTASKSRSRGHTSATVTHPAVVLHDVMVTTDTIADDDDDAPSCSDLDQEPSATAAGEEGDLNLGYESSVSESDGPMDLEDVHQLSEHLASEQPTWNTMGKLEVHKGQGTDVRSQNDSVPHLHLSDLDDSDYSEFRPEEDADDQASEEQDEPIDIDALDDDELIAWALKPRVPKKLANKPRRTNARQIIEQPVWKDNIPQAHATNATVKTQRQPASNRAERSPSLFSDDEDETQGNQAASHVTNGPAMNLDAPLTQQPVPVPAVVEPAAAMPKVLLPASYAIVPAAQPGGVLSLNAQHPHIRDMVRGSFISLEADLSFVNAFPDGLGRNHTIARALQEMAMTLGYTGLLSRLQTDDAFLRALSALPKQRISTFRSAIKKITDSHVLAYYSIKAGDSEKKPETYNVPYNKPYRHPVFESVLRASFFSGTSSVAHKHPYRFGSTSAQHPEAKEVPMAMLALVGAALHASLSEWKTGAFKPTSFSADAYLDVYQEHITLLQIIKDKNARAYHRLMHDLYNLASGQKGGSRNATVTPGPGNALSVVDVDGMDVDSD
ncbi:hypothetical protein C8Q74DRAFT_1450516 [Fomes fomentarius]|nr:hypothetical protein C8Q74DRAFT_1450516 [Fomes fomentarius]